MRGEWSACLTSSHIAPEVPLSAHPAGSRDLSRLSAVRADWLVPYPAQRRRSEFAPKFRAARIGTAVGDDHSCFSPGLNPIWCPTDKQTSSCRALARIAETPSLASPGSSARHDAAEPDGWPGQVPNSTRGGAPPSVFEGGQVEHP